jgi:hypothetical protein
MPLNRRHFTLGLALTPLTKIRLAKAEEPRGLFWTATAPGKPPCILFGYARAAAAVTADIVNDGDRFAGQAHRLVGDVANIQMPPISIPHDVLPPVFGRVSPATAGRIRAILDKSFAAMPNTEKLSAFEIVFLLNAEGQTPPQPSVGGTIAEHAQAAGKPIGYLVSADEVKAAFHQPDLPALDKKIDEDALNYLLTLRDTVGPIGKYQEGLYAARRTADLAKTAAEMKARGVPSLADIMPTAALAGTIIDRSIQTVQGAQEPLFAMLPVGILTQDDGILTTLKVRGVHVSLLA